MDDDTRICCHVLVFNVVEISKAVGDSLCLTGIDRQVDEDFDAITKHRAIEIQRKALDYAKRFETVDPIGNRRRREVDVISDVAVGSTGVCEQETDDRSVDVIEVAHGLRMTTSCL
jgi:hypothetical protein